MTIAEPEKKTRKAWAHIQIGRDQARDALDRLTWTLFHAERQGDDRLIHTLAAPIADLQRAVYQLTDYLVRKQKEKPPGTADDHVSTGTVDVPERDSDDGGTGGGG